MVHLTLEGYLTKSLIKRQLGRHPRTLTKDVSKALEVRDEELLSLCRLKRQNGQVIEGTEVTPEIRDHLVQDGENPQWYFLPEFVATVVKRQSHSHDFGQTSEELADSVGQRSSRARNTRAADKSTDSVHVRAPSADAKSDVLLPQLPKDAVERAAILEHLYLEKAREVIKERSRYDDLVPIIKDIPKQTEKMVEAMQGLQALFANTQEREKALNPGKTKEQTHQANSDTRTDAVVIEADFTDSSHPSTQKTQVVRSAPIKRATGPAKKKRTPTKRIKPKPMVKSPPKKRQSFIEKNLPSLMAAFRGRSN